MLQDSFQRKIDYVRLSLTDHCNFQCFYCRPPFQKKSFIPASDYLSAADIKVLFEILTELGVTKVKLTGGEPLLRKDMCEILQKLSSLSKLKDISLTTNGFFLEKMASELKASGLDRINISLDSLNPKTFEQITKSTSFFKVWRGILKALEVGFQTVKLNVVLMKGINEGEVEDFLKLTQDYPLTVRFIEFMPTRKTAHLQKDFYVSNHEVIEKLKQKYDLVPKHAPFQTGPSRNYVLKDAKGSIGFISPLSNHFCDQCNRLRVTCRGKLRLCLFDAKEMDLLPLIRNQSRVLRAAHAKNLFVSGNEILRGGFAAPRDDGRDKLKNVIIESLKIKPFSHTLETSGGKEVESFVMVGG